MKHHVDPFYLQIPLGALCNQLQNEWNRRWGHRLYQLNRRLVSPIPGPSIWMLRS